MKNQIYKLLILNSNNAPYRDPIHNYVTRLINNTKIFNYSKKDYSHNYWNFNEFDFEFNNLGFSISLGKRKFHPKIISILIKSDSDCIVIPGNYHFTSLIAFCISLLKKKKIIFVTDNISDRSKYLNFLKKIIYKSSFLIWVPGKASINYLIKSYSINKNKIIEGAYLLDYKSISQSVSKSINQIEKVKAELEIGSQKICLMVANFTPNRDHYLLFNIIKKINKDEKIFFIIIGTGAESKNIREFCTVNNISNYKILEKIQFESLAKYYAAADFYIHTGSEPYSTALQYAAIAGLPIISSLNIGAAWDYIVDAKNGFLINNLKDIDEWVNKIKTLLKLDVTRLKEMGEYSNVIATNREENIYMQLNSVFGNNKS